MKDYIVSARKYRPATFDSVVGQKALTVTLKNAIATGKLAHAYLFCGPRGVGKTTCARIFAKTINCLNLSPQGEACNECESCKAFNEQRSYNIHELDAASNNSVEDIRSLIDQVRIPPQVGQYKVFIIDEVHMLSTAAFNAFLKTLEEPPHHAIFILATTEKHKILPTILSRCQIYDFNRMTVNDTVEHLRHVAEQEGITVEVEALNVIAQKADGGMRDALSIFDQVVSFSNGQVTYQRVIENLNVLDYEYYFRMTDYLLGNKVADAMLLLNEILNKGFDGHHFITGLASHLRDLLVSRDAVTLPLLEVSDSVKQRYSEQAQKCPPRILYAAIKLCNDCDLNYRTSKNKRLLVEITLIQVAQLSSEEADVSGGRSPKKILKPLFKQQAAGKSVAAKEQVPQAKAPVAAGNGVSSLPNQSSLSQNQSSNASSPTASSPFSNLQMGGRKIPVVKEGELSVSIRPKKQEATEEQKQPEQKPQPNYPVSVQEDCMFNGDDLRFYWLDFANRLPVEESAIAGRMKGMRPKLLNDTTFEIVVNNELVEKSMQQMIPRVQDYMRAQLRNSKITMQVRVSQGNEQRRAYTRVEQYKLMASKNPSLLKLRDTFGLELA